MSLDNPSQSLASLHLAVSQKICSFFVIKGLAYLISAREELQEDCVHAVSHYRHVPQADRRQVEGTHSINDISHYDEQREVRAIMGKHRATNN